LPDGSIVGEETAGARRFRLDAKRSFRIAHRSYGAGESERCVEIPWVVSRYEGERRVLDIGTSFAERRYLEALRSLTIPSLFALDLVPAKRVRAIAGDARTPPLRAGTFDAIFAISVIEHIGRDNAVYLQGRHGPADADGDFTSIRALAALLAPGGRLLVTVPFGEPEDHRWFVQYDLDRLDRLTAASGLAVEEVEFFRYDGAWTGPRPPSDLRGCKYGVDAVAATGLACLSLVNHPGGIALLRRSLRRWTAWLTS
jgi:SAM-dependent methyltransferase